MLLHTRYLIRELMNSLLADWHESEEYTCRCHRTIALLSEILASLTNMKYLLFRFYTVLSGIRAQLRCSIAYRAIWNSDITSNYAKQIAIGLNSEPE